MARFWEDVEVGTELCSLVKTPTTREVVMWAAATGELGGIHIDKDFAVAHGFAGVILHGDLGMSYLCQLVTDWIGPEGILKKLNTQYRDVNYPNDTLTCKGRVTNKEVRGAENLAECEIWLENGKGKKTVIGSATVALPSRLVHLNKEPSGIDNRHHKSTALLVSGSQWKER